GETRTPLDCWCECKLVYLLWKTEWPFLKKLIIELTFNPVTPLLGIYPKGLKSGTQTGICTLMFIVASFTNLKVENNPNCPSTDEWIKKMWFIYTMEYYMAMRKNEIWPCVATWMDLEGVMLSEISQAEKERYHMSSLIGGL
ncbi:LORF2 protein, partial [Crocuta crocuta]